MIPDILESLEEKGKKMIGRQYRRDSKSKGNLKTILFKEETYELTLPYRLLSRPPSHLRLE
jgi:hypothetical protein